jgi:hypothetical protein
MGAALLHCRRRSFHFDVGVRSADILRQRAIQFVVMAHRIRGALERRDVIGHAEALPPVRMLAHGRDEIGGGPRPVPK